MSTRGQGWLSREKRKKGEVYIHHFYHTRNTDGARVETCRTVGLVDKFPRESDVWAEIERSKRISSGNSGRTTVSGLVESYRSTELPTKAHSTQELHQHILDSYILVRWGKVFVDEVRVLDLKRWFIAIAEENNLAAQTVQKIKQVFGRLFAYGSENELIPMNLNPVKACNIAKIGSKRKSQVIIVPPETANAIAMDLPIQHRTLVFLAAGTGLRMSELLGLRWADIDFDTKTIHLNRTWLYGRIGEGKTEASRKPLPIGSRIADLLQEWHRATCYSGPQDWVFASSKLGGKRPISGSQFVKDYIRPRFVKHGLIDAAYTGRAGLHAFRHSLATVLITEANVNPKTVQGLLRHANSAITMDIYTHAQEAGKRAALGLLEARLVN